MFYQVKFSLFYCVFFLFTTIHVKTKMVCRNAINFCCNRAKVFFLSCKEASDLLLEKVFVTQVKASKYKLVSSFFSHWTKTVVKVRTEEKETFLQNNPFFLWNNLFCSVSLSIYFKSLSLLWLTCICITCVLKKKSFYYYSTYFDLQKYFH